MALTTRISLRNDYLSAWSSSTVKLNKGEVALARLDGDKYEMRIGVGDKTWSELSSGGIVIPAANVEGLTDTISQLSTSYYETGDITTLTGDYVNGDIAVEKKTIAEGKQTYSAYRWSVVSGESKWVALDGCYNASNVYFDENLTYTTSLGVIAAPTGGSGELATAGKSVEDLFKQILAKESTSLAIDKSSSVKSAFLSVATNTLESG